ncbi:MAG: hypothetical protein QOH03_2277, partial [Kribbellaceae bacterium]|nr:hypothetical protein [Kribbellaceae bacterium]
MTRLGQRLRQADVRHPWVLDTTIVVLAFLLLCLPDLVGGRHGPRELEGTFAALPVAEMLALQAGLVVPLLWRRRAPFVAFGIIA